MQSDPLPDTIESKCFPDSTWKPIAGSWTKEDGWAWALHTPEGVFEDWGKVPLPDDRFERANARLESWIGFGLGLDWFTPLLNLKDVKKAQQMHPEGEQTSEPAFSEDWVFAPHQQLNSAVGLIQHRKTKHTLAVFLDGIKPHEIPVMVALTKTKEETLP